MKKAKTLPDFEPGHGLMKEDWDEVSDTEPATEEQLAQASRSPRYSRI